MGGLPGRWHMAWHGAGPDLLKLHVALARWVNAREQVVEQAHEDDHVLGQDLGDVEVAQRAEQHVALHLRSKREGVEGRLCVYVCVRWWIHVREHVFVYVCVWVLARMQ